MVGSTCPQDFIDLAVALADASGAAIRPYFRTPVSIDDKADASPVTIADRTSEEVMRVLIEDRFPDHGIFGEEFAPKNPDAEYVWVLDPIDGTKAFICGLPVFGTLIALLKNGAPILGVINQPISGERWIGATGHPTTLNGTVVKTRACAELGGATLFTTDPKMFKGEERPAYDRLESAVKLARYGTDCYAYALLSTGFVDLVAEAQLQPYDYFALIPVVTGAGGIMSDWTGAPLEGLIGNRRVLAAGDAKAHAAAIALLTQ